MYKSKISNIVITSIFAASISSFAYGNDIYGPFPITEKSYSGDKTNSVSYTGQIARHVLHDTLKKIVGTEASTNIKQMNLDKMMPYFEGSDSDLSILAPATKGDFVVKQKMVNEISSGKNLSGKSYKGNNAYL